MTIVHAAAPFVLIAALAAAPASAASPFDGTWKTDITKIRFSDRPDEVLLAQGRYSCRSCVPAFTIPADGKPHPVAGHDYYDAVAVTVKGPRAVDVTGSQRGKKAFTNSWTVSADGGTATMASRRVNLATGAVATTSGTATRVAPAPAGAHAVSGSWRTEKAASASANALTQTLKVTDTTLTLSTPTGEGYTATFDGPAVTQANDPAKTMITVRKLSDRHIVETDSRDGKPVLVYDMTVAPDGRTMTMAVTDRRTGSTDTFVLDKM